MQHELCPFWPPRSHWDQCLLEVQGKTVLCSLPTCTLPSLLPQTRCHNFPPCNPFVVVLACIGQQTRWTIATEHDDNHLQLSFWGSLKFRSFKLLSHTSNRDLFWGSHTSFQQDNTRCQLNSLKIGTYVHGSVPSLHSGCFCCFCVISFLDTFRKQTSPRSCAGNGRCLLHKSLAHTQLSPYLCHCMQLTVLKTTAAPIPKCHLMVSGHLSIQEKKLFKF